jgi:hypothetical protein
MQVLNNFLNMILVKVSLCTRIYLCIYRKLIYIDALRSFTNILGNARML